MRDIRFTCTSLAGKDKRGVAKANEAGYYETLLGGLGCFNSAGQFYPYEEVASLFQESSHFMRRVARGVMASELGHPKQLPGMTTDQWIQRLFQIWETNVCAHIMQVKLDFENYTDDNGRKVIGIVGLVKPDGPHGPSLAQAFTNPNQNVCFSIRAMSDDKVVSGRYERILREIITFDRVTEPGIPFAEKFKTASLESLVDFGVSPKQLYAALEGAKTSGVSTESLVISPADLMKSLGIGFVGNKAPDWVRGW